MKQMTLPVAIREYLTLPTENFTNIKENLSKLTDKDKQDLTEEFAKIGVEITKPATK